MHVRMHTHMHTLLLFLRQGLTMHPGRLGTPYVD